MKNKTISFVIPCYNEEARIEKTFEALTRVVIPRGLKLDQIIFVDDGSIDKTFVRMTDFAKSSNLPISVISYKTNRGKGNAIRIGMTASTADYSLFFDADMSTPLSELAKFAPVMKTGVDVIIGTRKNGHSTVVKHQPLMRELMGKVFTKITQILLGVGVTDFTCGFKAFSRNATNTIFPKAIIEGWGYDAEIIFLAARYKFKIKEVAVTWANDERTKVNLRSAIIKTLLELVEIRWNHSIKEFAQVSTSNFNFAGRLKDLL